MASDKFKVTFELEVIDGSYSAEEIKEALSISLDYDAIDEDYTVDNVEVEEE